ncbi:MAG: hypothetical protein FWD38_00235 [Oscillospiraceae bacterium]|nr:hypothetical protein [Oscillospiraceae bacterium]
MKILKIAMLSLLGAICAVAATVAVMHFTGFELNRSNNAGLISDAQIADAEEENNAFYMPFAGISEDTEDYRMWQRVMEKQAETGYWKFFPLIPYDSVMPGEKVVLSVSTENFMGWDLDPNFAYVELFDETLDEENAQISFIMPEEVTFVAALYTEMPYINYENQRAERMANRDTHEYGSLIAPASAEIPVETGALINLPITAVGDVFNIVFRDPANIVYPPGAVRVRWDMNETPPNEIPWWLRFTPNPTGGGSLFSPNVAPEVNPDEPTVIQKREGIYIFYADLTYLDASGNPIGGSGDAGTVTFRLDVRPPSPDPTIATDTVPDGMAGVRYNVPIDTLSFNHEFTWAWALDGIDTVPPGLIVRAHPDDNTKGNIFSPNPENLAVTSGSYEFKIRASTADSGIADVVSDTLYIRIWPQPDFTLQKWSNEGIVLYPFNPEVGTDTAIYDEFTEVLGTSLIIPTSPTESPTWGWVTISGSLPAGLDFKPVEGNISKLAVTGVPAADTAGRNFSISIIFKSTNELVLIGETKPITIPIKIWPRPEYAEVVLPDGMVGPDPAAGPMFSYDASPTVEWSIQNETIEEVYRESFIKIDGLPDGTNKVNWTKTAALPVGLKFDDSESNVLEILGATTKDTVAGDYKFKVPFALDHDNPNIKGVGAIDNTEFEIRIWNRAYLVVLIQPSERNMAGQVKRDRRVDSLGGYQTYARAIIPGEWGSILAGQSTNDFVRWEITKVTNEKGAVATSTALPHPQGLAIGANWGLSPRGSDATSWVEIQMPEPATRTSLPMNVIISGHHVGPPLIVTNAPPNLPNGTVDVPYTGSFRIDNLSAIPSAVGTGPVPRTWELTKINESNKLPTVIEIDSGSGVFFNAEPNPDTFTFGVTLTLPGTMRVTYGRANPTALGVERFGVVVPGLQQSITPFSILIDVFRPNYGDVDGNGSLNLADLVLLSRFRNGTVEQRQAARDAMNLKNSMRNGNIITEYPFDPDDSDLFALTQWFAREGMYDTFVDENK